MTSHGSFPGLRTIANPAPIAYASGAAKMKPRDSMPTTLSIRSSFQRATKVSITWRKSVRSPRTGVMSLKTIPFFGKSGTSRMRARTASMAANLTTAGAAAPLRQEEQRVLRARPVAHLEVQVRAGRPAALPDARDRLPAADRVPVRDEDLRVVRVQG